MLRDTILDAIGDLCKIILPIKYDIFYGNGDSVAICTLSSIDLLLKIANSDIMDKVVLVARLFSENKGIERIIEYSYNNKLKTIILCGKDAKGHFAGQSLLALKKYGIKDGRIINAKGKMPILKIEKEKIDEFISNVKIIDMIGITDISKIRYALTRL